MSLHIIILAAGMGKRMHSTVPKVMHQIAGVAMLEHVVKTAQSLRPEAIHTVIGHECALIQQTFAHLPTQWVHQQEQLGTGHAVQQALPFIPDEATLLILSADVPLIETSTLKALVDQCLNHHALGLLVATLTNPFGLGRIIRDKQHRVCRIIEEKDASPNEKAIHEIYSGICSAKASDLKQWLPQLTNHNAQQEYYLTDIIKLAVQQQVPIISQTVANPIEIQGVNDRAQLQQLERAWQERVAMQLMLAGVTLADAKRLDVRGELQCGQDVYIDVNNVFVGTVQLGDNTVIEPNCWLKNVTVGKNCTILANSVLEGCSIGDFTQVGPFSRIRPGTQLAHHCKIGNFVEAKNAIFGEHTKANHLSYLGDTTIGRYVNIGAGTITCNYDGANKHQTIIEDNVHIGSDTQLVAPVTVGQGATIGAGSTIRKNAPPGELTLTASVQKTTYGWKRPTKDESA